MSHSRWQDHKTLLHAWLLIFFPVGLYALWAGSVYEKNIKWMITAAVVIMVLALGAGFDALLALVFAPLAVFLVWKDNSIARPTVYKFAAGAVVIVLIVLARPAKMAAYDDGSGVFTDGNCTYYRDSNGNVIGRSCD